MEQSEEINFLRLKVQALEDLKREHERMIAELRAAVETHLQRMNVLIEAVTTPPSSIL